MIILVQVMQINYYSNSKSQILQEQSKFLKIFYSLFSLSYPSCVLAAIM